jgi:hypothetical protein
MLSCRNVCLFFLFFLVYLYFSSAYLSNCLLTESFLFVSVRLFCKRVMSLYIKSTHRLLSFARTWSDFHSEYVFSSLCVLFVFSFFFHLVHYYIGLVIAPLLVILSQVVSTRFGKFSQTDSQTDRLVSKLHCCVNNVTLDCHRAPYSFYCTQNGIIAIHLQNRFICYFVLYHCSNSTRLSRLISALNMKHVSCFKLNSFL